MIVEFLYEMENGQIGRYKVQALSEQEARKKAQEENSEILDCLIEIQESENEICITCNGSGERQHPGAKCNTCNGKGEIIEVDADLIEFDRENYEESKADR